MRLMPERPPEKGPGAKRTPSRQLLLNVALLVVTVFCALMFCEIVVRILFARDMALFPRYHTDATYDGFTIRRLRPNAVFRHRSADGIWKFTTNSQGFRDNFDFAYPKEPGTLRVICLGDSNTEGFEARQEFTFSAIIQRFLNREGLKAEVYNMGVSGYSTSEELILLEHEAVKYKPDYIVLGFFANDYEDNVRANLFTIRNGALVLNKKVYIPGVGILNRINEFYIIRKLSEHSYLYSFLFNHIWKFVKDRRAEQERVEHALPRSTRSTYEIDLARLLIGRMMTFCKSQGIGFIVVDIPDVDGSSFKGSMDRELVEYVKREGGIYMDTVSLLAPYRGLVDIHVPHGARHISEFTHLMIGLDAGRAMLNKGR